MWIDEYVLRSRKRLHGVDEHVETVKFAAQDAFLKRKLHVRQRICKFGIWHWGQKQNCKSASGYENENVVPTKWLICDPSGPQIRLFLRAPSPFPTLCDRSRERDTHLSTVVS
jgi:hypothetical protein